MANSLYLTDIEQHMLGLLLCDPSVWPDVQFICRDEFAEVRQHLFDVIKQQLDSNQSVTPIIVAEKLKSYGQSGSEIGGVETLVYLEGLQRRGKMIEKKEALALAKELKKATVKRQLIAACRFAAQKVEKAESFEEMTEAVTNTISKVSTEYYKGGESEDVFKGLIEMVEEKGNQQNEDLGYVGVLPSVDKTLGPLIHKGSFFNLSARSGVGKSSFGFFYSVSTLEKYPEMKILWCDAGEMTVQQLQFRATVCFSQGRVPLWALRSGAWRKNKEWVDILRGDVWPRVKKLIGRVEYRNVSGMTAKEKTAFMRRHYFNKAGRDSFLLVVDDYLKGMESLNRETKEYMSIGYYTSDVKNLVTDEINGGFMTFTQSNRFGISKGKKAEDIVDNDSVVSISDRIKDNCTTNFLMRFKVPEELGREKNSFGNVVLKNLKIREGLGREFEKFARPIKMANGHFAEDYFNLEYHGFHYQDKGLFSEMMARLGHTAIDLTSINGEKQNMP